MPKGWPLPAVLPAGELPTEDSRMWLFTPKSIVAGRAWIQSDTHEWLDANWPVPVARDYPTHPRWLLPNRPTMRSAVANANIVAEVHLAIRLMHDLPEFPPHVHGRIALKQMQSSLAYRLTKATHKAVADKTLDETIVMFRDKAPGQFLKWVTNTFIPKKIEVEKVPVADEGLNREDARKIGDAIMEELERRAAQAQFDAAQPHDTEAIDILPQETLDLSAKELHAGAAEGHYKIGSSRNASPETVTQRLASVRDVSSLDAIDWDN